MPYVCICSGCTRLFSYSGESQATWQWPHVQLPHLCSEKVKVLQMCTVHAASEKKRVFFSIVDKGHVEIGPCFEAQQSVSHCLESLTSSISSYLLQSLSLHVFATDQIIMGSNMHSYSCNSWLEADASRCLPWWWDINISTADLEKKTFPKWSISN